MNANLQRRGGLRRNLPAAVAGIALAAGAAIFGLVPQGEAVAASSTLPVEGHLPEFTGATAWLNSAPITAQSLRGKVVLVDFWTYGCSNCQHVMPHVRAWAEKYKDQGLVVIGVHAPEFAAEHRLDNVKAALADLGITFPVAVDNDFTLWRAYDNHYWPANYFVDAQGQIRFHHFGEGEYERSEQVIRQLLDEAKAGARPG